MTRPNGPGVVVAGLAFPCAAPVLRWDDPGGLAIEPGGPGTRPRLRQIDTCVLHWTASENEASNVHRNLQTPSVRRPYALGVEFIIDRLGRIHQTCDPAQVDAKDCGRRWDPRSVGVEIVNYGMQWPYSKPWSLLKVPARARDRELVRTTLRGSPVYVARFYPNQLGAVLALVDTLLDALPWIEPKVPRDGAGEVLDRTLTADEQATWVGGVLGHYHISSRKPDPGLPLMRTVGRHLGD